MPYTRKDVDAMISAVNNKLRYLGTGCRLKSADYAGRRYLVSEHDGVGGEWSRTGSLPEKELARFLQGVDFACDMLLRKGDRDVIHEA